MNIRRQSGNYQFEEDPFSKNVKGIGKIYHEVLLLMNFFQTKPQVRNMNIIYMIHITPLLKREVKKKM